MKISVVSEMWKLSRMLGSYPVRGGVVGQSGLTPHSRKRTGGLNFEPTHMEDEDEDEDQENEKEDERDGEECKVESRRESRHTQAPEAWMT